MEAYLDDEPAVDDSEPRAGRRRAGGRVRRRRPRRRAGRPSCQAQGTGVRAELGRDHVRRRQARLIGSLRSLFAALALSVAAASVAGPWVQDTATVLVPEAWVERLARIALALPDAYQEEAWVGERWRVRGRTFAHVLPIEAGRPEAYSRAVGSPGPHVVMTFRADPEELEAITRSGPALLPRPLGHRRRRRGDRRRRRLGGAARAGDRELLPSRAPQARQAGGPATGLPGSLTQSLHEPA